ncbi:hypothetical protein C8F04DRAFT_1397090 [Mycena alexandri]|uniref:Uncharacterized protein n=1 Tax=Mycena alexandri TaxID=1745969 RepID=A0AAD6SQJ8_9AGAR|nr:hypothetical protein C8F04DRAFT_1397090 [Mycena alexandri]
MPSVPRSSQASRALRRSQSTRITATKFECAAQAHLLAQKRRIPLATKYNVNSNVTAASTKISLPRALSRPVLGEVETSSLVGAYPDLAGIPAEYIRERLALSRPKMRAALQAVEISISKSTLPTELDILMNEVVSFACPTHMFAVYNDAPLPISHKRQISLFPIHDLVFGMHCTNLPTLPTSRPSSSSSHTTVPVVPLRLPSPETFSLLHAYLYTQQPATLLASLARPCETDLLQLAAHANKIHGLWRNACLLGVVDAQLYDVIEASWESTIAAMQACS